MQNEAFEANTYIKEIHENKSIFHRSFAILGY